MFVPFMFGILPFLSLQQLLSPQFPSVSLPSPLIYHFVLPFLSVPLWFYLWFPLPLYFKEINRQPAPCVSITRPGLRLFALLFIMKSQLAQMQVLLAPIVA